MVATAGRCMACDDHDACAACLALVLAQPPAVHMPAVLPAPGGSPPPPPARWCAAISL